MGYTHYWRHGDIAPEDWAALVADADRIVEAAEVPVNHNISTKEIWLNGASPDSFESFALRPEATGFSFCKTEQRPYDLVVATILLRAHAIIPGFEISSDGNWDEHWQATRNLYFRLFGELPKGGDSPLGGDE